MLRAFLHPVIWFRSYHRALIRPVKWILIAGALGYLILLGQTTYINHQVNSTVEPIQSRLSKLSDNSNSKSSKGLSGVYWSSRFHFPEEKMNRESHGIIKETLLAKGWEVQDEAAVLLPENIMGGFMIRAEKSGYTYLAYLPKSGADLQIVVAKTGQPEVSRPTEELKTTGR